METILGCRSCGASNLQTILSLGDMPLADVLIDPDNVDLPPVLEPLTLVFCPNCSLVQIRETVPPNELFNDDYPYYSSFSNELLDLARANANELVANEGLDTKSFVVELASNDGYMLRNFHERGIPVLGFDPAAGPVRAAKKLGIPSRKEFFTKDVAQQLRDARQSADVLIANNVLAHVADTNGFVEGLATVLKLSGVATIEFPYVRNLIEHCEFDTIYHQHLCYFSLTSVNQLLSRAGLTIHDVKRIPIHGGSLRLYVSHDRQQRPSVSEMLREERECGLTELNYYQGFAQRVEALCADLREMVCGLAKRQKRIACYGAAGKGATMLGCLGLPRGTIDYVVDRNNHKHGRYMPGSLIPVDSVERLEADKPDYVLMLAWNFKDEILNQQRGYREAGGKFIIPVPEIQVV